MGKIAGEIRAIIAGAVFENAAGDVNAGIFFVGEFDVRKSFVIAQQDVEARFVLLDEVVFKGERFLVVIDLNKIDVACFGDETTGLGFRQPDFIEVTPYTATKILRFPDIQNLPFAIFVKVNARLGGKLRYFLAEFHLAAYNLIVPRVCKFLFLSTLVGYPIVVGAQTPATPQQPAPKQAEQQPPDETNPPEEDESVAPKKYVLNPLEAKRNIDVGNFYWKKGDYRGALDRYRDATHYNPSSAEAFLRVGEAEEKLHNVDKAKAAFEKVIKLAPDSKFAAEAKKKLGSIKG